MGPGARALAALPIAAVIVPASAHAQSLDTAFGRAEIAPAGTIVNEDAMDFGQIVPRANPGTVVLTPSASATCTTTGGLVRSGPCRAARFTGNAANLTELRVQRPAGNQIDLLGAGGATMRLDNFTFGSTAPTVYLGQQGVHHRFRIDAPTGDYTFYVGGTLRVGANQAPGVYIGTFEVRLNYN